jgi:hypothetical protein
MFSFEDEVNKAGTSNSYLFVQLKIQFGGRSEKKLLLLITKTG